MFVRSCLFSFTHVLVFTNLVACTSIDEEIRTLQGLNYRIYPRRAQDEAAVIEWGNSAIISALDASVAHFGPQTGEAALFEVETMPILANPINGVRRGLSDDEPSEVASLENAEEVHGNMVVMTNTGGLSGVKLAKIAQKSGAVALLLVNVDEKRPDDIFRLPAEEGAAEIEIPVVMISFNSANVLTTATVTPEMTHDDIVNNGMPERIRLYAGDDRPFFEDVEATEPTIYIIHNLLSAEECDTLIAQAKPVATLITEEDVLQLTQDVAKYRGVERAMLWQGILQSPEKKQIEERIEQVTGFPSNHFSDFIVDRFSGHAHWKTHYDTLAITSAKIPMASMTVFLSDATSGGEIVYPSTRGSPVKITPKRGMAVVHHNMDEHHQFDTSSAHAVLPVTSKGDAFYIARKYVFVTPVSNARRIALPVFALPLGGELPSFLPVLYKLLSEKFGHETGGSYFDKLCVFIPLLVLLGALQLASDAIQRKMKNSQPKKKDD